MKVQTFNKHKDRLSKIQMELQQLLQYLMVEKLLK